MILPIGRHPPRFTPIHIGGIIFWIKLSFVVNGAVRAVYAVLRQCRFSTVAPLVGFPAIFRFGFSFTPGEVVAVVFGAAGTDVARCPQCAAGEAQVNVLMVLGLRCLSDNDGEDGMRTHAVSIMSFRWNRMIENYNGIGTDFNTSHSQLVPINVRGEVG